MASTQRMCSRWWAASAATLHVLRVSAADDSSDVEPEFTVGDLDGDTGLSALHTAAIWAGLLVAGAAYYFLYARAGAVAAAATTTAGGGGAVATAAATVVATVDGDGEMQRARAARLARFGSEEARRAAQAVMDANAATGLTVEEKKPETGLRNRQFGARVGSFGATDADKQKPPDAGKYKKGNEYFGGDSTVFEGND